MGRKNKNKRTKKKSVHVTSGSHKEHLPSSALPRSVEHTPESLHETVIVPASPPPASKTRLALIEGRKDLKNAQPPLGFLFNPIRAIVLDPSIALASIVLPGIVTAVPVIDGITATSIRIPFSITKFAYGLLPFRGDFGDTDLALIAKNDLLAITGAGSNPLPPLLVPESFQNFLQVSIAFGLSTVADLAIAMVNPAKASTWIVSLWQVFRFLDSSQLDNNLTDAVVRPFYGGRFVDNINIYRQIQEAPEHRIHRVKRFRRSQIQQSVNEGARMMKYATAAYATGMIQFSLENREIQKKEFETAKSVIAKHVGIKKNDLKHLCVSEGGNMKLLRHFIAVDRKTRNVVLAIRGTLSVSGALIDMQAEDAVFCTGKAHRGMSEMAVNLWNASGAKIQETFSQLEANDDLPWGLVLVGHSLGAGTAALLNIKCHVEGLLGASRAVKCFGFASPPVFDMAAEQGRDSVAAHAIDKAIKNCTCYIQGEDCIPFLSVSSVSRIAAQLEVVDDATKTMWPLDRMAIASGDHHIPQDLIDGVHSVKHPMVPGASRLTIPAEKIVWAFSNGTNGFDAIGCVADELANLSIYVSSRMITDHLPKEYEDSLEALAK